MSLEFLMRNEFGRFLLGGGVNAVFSYTLYFLFNLYLHFQMAYGLAFAASILFSYWLNNRWVFRTTANWKTFFSFPFVYLAQYVFGAFLLHVFVEGFGMSEWLSPLVVIVLSIPITFFMSRFVLKGKWKFDKN